MIGILCGVLLTVLGAVESHFDYAPGKGTTWAYLIMAALPIAAWGASHLARYRGYSTGVGYGLFVLGAIFSGCLAGGTEPEAAGIVCLFAELLPVVVLLALPRK
jgi:hypothetical protein